MLVLITFCRAIWWHIDTILSQGEAFSTLPGIQWPAHGAFFVLSGALYRFLGRSRELLGALGPLAPFLRTPGFVETVSGPGPVAPVPFLRTPEYVETVSVPVVKQ